MAIISGFPAIGKTTLAKKNNTIYDLESSIFCRGDFKNYIKCIEMLNNDDNIILISSHIKVREILLEKGIDYTLVKPQFDLKNEYVKRAVDRQPHCLKPEVVEKNWDAFMEELPNEKVKTLKSGEFITVKILLEIMLSSKK